MGGKPQATDGEEEEGSLSPQAAVMGLALPSVLKHTWVGHVCACMRAHTHIFSNKSPSLRTADSLRLEARCYHALSVQPVPMHLKEPDQPAGHCRRSQLSPALHRDLPDRVNPKLSEAATLSKPLTQHMTKSKPTWS